MSKAKSVRPSDNRSNQQNANRGTKGTNVHYDKAQGNRGTQLNPQAKK